MESAMGMIHKEWARERVEDRQRRGEALSEVRSRSWWCRSESGDR